MPYPRKLGGAMSTRPIEFRYENTVYVVGADTATHDGVIRLPDGRTLEAQNWSEAIPAYPMGLTLVDCGLIGNRPIFEATAA